jgi:hypothetical protein
MIYLIDAMSCSDYIAPKVVNDDLKMMLKKVAMVLSKHYPGIRLEGLTKNNDRFPRTASGSAEIGRPPRNSMHVNSEINLGGDQDVNGVHLAQKWIHRRGIVSAGMVL